MNVNEMTEVEYLKHYKEVEVPKYEKPSVCVDMAILTLGNKKSEDVRKKGEVTLKVVMLERAEHPHKGKWSLAGGFMGMTETLDETVERKLQEDLGMENVYFEQLYTFSDVERDPRLRVVSTSYMALVSEVDFMLLQPKLATNSDLFDVSLQEVSTNNSETIYKLALDNEKGIELTSTIKVVTTKVGRNTKQEIIILDTDLAFDHAKILAYAILRLKNKVGYTNVVFDLMPEKFTLPNLQKVYEMILGRGLNKVQFRKFVKPMVIELDEEIKEGAYRPSKLYTYNVDWNENLI